MARSLSATERALLSAMVTSAKPADATRFSGTIAWRNWRDEVRQQLDRLTAGASCDCGKCPSFHLLFDGAPVTESATPVILEAFVPDGMVMLFVDGNIPSYLEVAPNLDEEIGLPAATSLIF